MKRTFGLLLGFILAIMVSGCSSTAAGLAEAVLGRQSGDSGTVNTVAAGVLETDGATPVDVAYDDADLDSDGDDIDTWITLGGEAFVVDGPGALADGKTLTILSPGTYSISGTLGDGRIIVNSEDKGAVKLILNGASLTSSSSAPIYVFNADKTVITLAEGSVNSVTDAATYVLDDPGSGEPDAAIFSNDDLTINGDGSLAVTANYKNGIASDDDLKITGGTITVSAVNDGLQARDSIAIKDGVLNVAAGGDGLRATNDDEADQGYIAIEGGNLKIVAAADGIQAETAISVSGGMLSVVSGGGSGNAIRQAGWGGGRPNENAAEIETDDTTDTPRGLQAGGKITVTDGSLDVDSVDDALHAGTDVTIIDGRITLAAGDDGIHAETSIEISGGSVSISQSYEGLEGKAIIINGGTIHVVASDDGLNGPSGQAEAFGTGGRGAMQESGDSSLIVNDGYLVIDATGDGLDIGGPITMTGGTVIVNGPTSNGDGPVDYMGSFEIDGGFFLAVGSAGMAEASSPTSTQAALMLTFSSTVPSGTLLHVETQGGQEILTFAPIREIQSALFSSPDLETGTTYVITTGGNPAGDGEDGLYSGGSSSKGSEFATVTIEDTVTYIGSYAGGFNGGPGGGRPGGQPPLGQ